ncbi:MAG TPA: DUF3482 domain-containing protein [Allosphingosinicella sp.]|nr:DUF3482 domain-containing protein [Allosphingosinicella sp.]
MRNTGMIGLALAASLSMAACTTYDRYGYDDRYHDRTLGRTAAGAALGAAAGAGVGAVVGGVGVGEGAAVGAVAGGLIGAATADNDRRWYRDDYGRCFYVDRDGYRRYDDRVRC